MHEIALGARTNRESFGTLHGSQPTVLIVGHAFDRLRQPRLVPGVVVHNVFAGIAA
ncbi:hypothetical protein K7N18_35185 [Burkholderia arboris]|uniref:hypothetical protein n=1 Tax=Burkholderia arboris TaxID=488730 RepID=UPI001CA407FC|nr:hypothetical protein [Burkholderia arboris]MBY8610068.1 hypothetical protein [Burkholderia arboris]